MHILSMLISHLIWYFVFIESDHICIIIIISSQLGQTIKLEQSQALFFQWDNSAIHEFSQERQNIFKKSWSQWQLLFITSFNAKAQGFVLCFCVLWGLDLLFRFATAEDWCLQGFIYLWRFLIQIHMTCLHCCSRKLM